MLVVFLMLAFAITNTRAQVGLSYFPADPANLYDWRAELVNPSIGVFQTGAVEMGVKLFHLGFVDNDAAAFQAAYFLLNLPRRLPEQLGLGLQVQSFRAGLFQESEFKLNLSRRLQPNLSLGIGLALRHFGYDRAQFDLVDPDDPVFAGGTSRWQPDLGLGLTYMPLTPLVLTLSVSHLNRPAVTLTGDAVTLDMELRLGVSLNLGGYAAHSNTRFEEENATHAYLQLQDETVGLLQLGVENRSAWMKSRLNLPGPFRFGYGFSYPLNSLSGTSWGNHETFLVYEFDPRRKAAPVILPEENWEPFDPEMAHVDVVPQYYASAGSEVINIFEKQLVRMLDADLDSSRLARLSAFDVGVLDSALHEPVFPYQLEPLTPADSQAVGGKNYAPEYRESLHQLRGTLVENGLEVVLITPKTQRKRAAGLREYLRQPAGDSLDVALAQPHYLSREDSLRFARPVNPQDLPASERLVIIQPQSVAFSVLPVLPEQLAPEWELVVEDKSGKTIFRYDGSGAEGREVVWDWRDTAGRIIEPGLYRYYVGWKDQRGEARRSSIRTLYARKLKRNVRILITRTYRSPDGQVDKVGIILNQ